jgi:L-ribulose-5-phosphate 3-epimerase
MKTCLNRRTFLKRTALAAGGISLAPVAQSVVVPMSATPQPQPQSFFKISLAEWSLHRALRGGKMDHLDFPKTAREDYGLDAIELVNQFFKDKARDEKYLAELKKRADDAGVKILLLMCDNEGALGDAD